MNHLPWLLLLTHPAHETAIYRRREQNDRTETERLRDKHCNRTGTREQAQRFKR